MIEHNIILFSIASIFGLFLLWSVGANDLANIMSTTMGSKAVSVKQAIIIGVIFETAGAMLGGDGVARTMQHGIINTQILNYPPEILIYGMLAAILASATWMTLGSRFGLPVSITNAIVGALVGFGVLVLGIHSVHWHQIGYIAISWVTAPTAAAVTALLLFMSIRRLILTASNPAAKIKRYIGYYLFIVGFVLSEITIVKACDHFGHPLNFWQNIAVAIVSGIATIIVGKLLIRRIDTKHDGLHEQFSYVEKVFAILMLFTACAMVYAHGSNDIATAIGPVATIASLLKTGNVFHNGGLLYIALALGALTVIIGFLTYGHKIIATVGSGITALTPSRAFSATIAAATAVVVSTSFGIPVSATQTLVGAILGVGLARGIGALDLRIVRNIFASWVITIPIAALLTVVFFNLIRLVVKL